MSPVSWIYFFVLLMAANRILLSHSETDVLSEVSHVFQLIDEINIGKAYSKNLEAMKKKNTSIKSNIQLLGELRNVFNGLSDLKTEDRTKSKLIIQTMIKDLRIKGHLQKNLNKILRRFSVIDNLYKKFSSIYLEAINSNVTELDEFFGRIISESSNGLNFRLSMLFKDLSGSGISMFGLRLMDLMKLHMRDTMKAHYCDGHLSSQQHIYNFFNLIVIKQLKGFIMLTIAYLHSAIKVGGYLFGIELIAKDTRERLVAQLHDAQEVIASTTTDIIRCGPTASNRKGFIELKGSFQGIVVDDEPWNIRCQSGEEHVCISPKKAPAKFATGNDVCMYQGMNKCLGQFCYDEMTDCETMSELVAVCEADRHSNRRYDYVKTGHKEIIRETDFYYRNKTDRCLQVQKQGLAGHIRAGYTIYPCYFCMCTCMGNGWKESDLRAISFLEQSTEISKLKAVVGVRFIEKYGMVHLQIKQGTVLPGGRVQEGSAEWKPIDKIERRFPSKNPQAPPEYYAVSTNRETKLEEYLEYTHISKNFKTISLSNIKVPKGYLITGVKLQFEKNPICSSYEVTDNAIELQITGTPFDFKIGQFTESKYQHPRILTSSKYRDRNSQRNKIKIANPDVSIDAPMNKVYRGSHQLVDFRVTDYKKDAGQTIVPFFDALPVEAIPHTPLSGIGLYFKSSPGYGGFIAPRIFTLHVYNFLNISVTLPGID